MTDPVERAATNVADEVRKAKWVYRREALAQRIEQAVRREWNRPIPLPRRHADDISLSAEGCIETLLGLEDDEFKLVIAEAGSRRLLPLELIVRELKQGDDEL
jgi:hypothetical protein